MPSNYKFEYNVDIVFCIDCTESMDNILNIVKGRALGLYDDIQCKMSSKGKKISQLRVRLMLPMRMNFEERCIQTNQ